MDDIKTSVTEEDLLEVIKVDKANPYASILPYFLNMGYSDVSYDGFALQKKEFIIYAAPATLYADKEKIVRYSGGSAGISVRVAKGLTLHQGARRGTPIRENVRDFISGDLVITNNRVVFIAEKGSFEFKFEKLTACKISAKNAFILQAGNKSKNIIVDENILKYVTGFINSTLECVVEGIDIYAEEMKRRKLRTPELLKHYEAAKRDIASIIESESHKNKFNFKFNVPSGLNFIRYFFGIIMMLTVPMLVASGDSSVISGIFYGGMGLLITPIGNKVLSGKMRFFVWLAFFFLFGLTVTVFQEMPKKTTYPVSTKNVIDSEISELANIDLKSKYDISEIVNFPGHPRIMELIDDASAFQEQLNDDRIKIISVSKKAEYERSLESIADEKTVLYFIKHVSSDDYIGEVDIKIYDSDFGKTLNVDKAVEILTSYLPVHFAKHYKKDAAYIKEDKNSIKYTYAVRLNNDGNVYRRTTQPYYSHYLSFSIIHYRDSGFWRMYTDYAAYGGKSLDWIQKFAKPWNINLNK